MIKARGRCLPHRGSHSHNESPSFTFSREVRSLVRTKEGYELGYHPSGLLSLIYAHIWKRWMLGILCLLRQGKSMQISLILFKSKTKQQANHLTLSILSVQAKVCSLKSFTTQCIDVPHSWQYKTSAGLVLEGTCIKTFLSEPSRGVQLWQHMVPWRTM
jgi:hypothetical protein